MACVSPEQQRQKDEAKAESIAKSYGINATGDKVVSEFDPQFSNLINNE